jgi:hypothetical protein
MKYLLLLVAACGRYGFADLADSAGSGSAGTRLEQQYNVFDGTLRQPSGVYDSLLADNCYAYPTTAGTRCMTGNPAVYYLDAACTQPVAAKTSTSPYVYDGRYPPITHAYTFGASVGTPGTVYTTQYDGTCGATTPPAELFQLTEIGLDTFARLAPSYGSEGRVVSSVLVADDGFRSPGPLHDTQLDADCIGETFDDRTACFVVPTDLAYFYLDSACTQVVDDAYTTVQFSEHELTVPACKTTDFEVRALGAELPRTTPIWVQIPGDTACIQTSVGAARRLFALGAPLELATVTRQPVPGARMQLIDSSAGGASAHDPFVVWDSQLGIECQPMVGADGVQRCLPRDAPYAQRSGYFTDTGCTQPIFGAGVLTCASTSISMVLDLEGATTGPHVFRAVAYQGPIYGGGPGNCTLYQNQSFVSEGAEVPLDMFAVVTQQTDP